jgi:ABC-type phosphate/phosphonate transport system substrate-binding protein
MRTLRAAITGLLICLCCLCALALRSASAAAPAASGHALRLGISSTLFQGMPEAIVIALMKPFEGLLIEQTGMNGELVPSGDGVGVAQSLVDGKIDVGVLEGVEFAWERQKHPDLKPLMITVNQEMSLHASIVVPKDSSAERFADLKGKPVELFRNCREHCRLFLKHLCKQAGHQPEQFFSKVKQVDNAEAVLDDVADKAVAAAVVDNLWLESFRRRKPARFALLKVIEKSITFPASVVVYREGTLDDATRHKFQQGMLNANKSVIGKQMLTMWKLTAFEMVPTDYEQTVTEFVKVYPAPMNDIQARRDKAE